MFSTKIALLSAATLLCAGVAMAQAPADNATQPPMMHQQHHDFAKMHQEMCEERPAHAAAKLAYVEAKLNLTDAQKPLFAKWRQVVLDGEAKEKAACLAATPKSDAMPHLTILERESHEETLLQARLDLLKSSRPTLQAFYDSLTEAQKQSFDHMHEEHMRGHHGMDHEGWGGDHDVMNHPQ